jgi:hypothetical protein
MVELWGEPTETESVGRRNLPMGANISPNPLIAVELQPGENFSLVAWSDVDPISQKLHAVSSGTHMAHAVNRKACIGRLHSFHGQGCSIILRAGNISLVDS